jgi:hypothetical protein
MGATAFKPNPDDSAVGETKSPKMKGAIMLIAPYDQKEES